MPPLNFLNRVAAAGYLTARGLKTSPKTLAKLACIGGGPIYQKYGRQVLYRPERLDEYAASRISGERRNTGEVTSPSAPRDAAADV
jgi:hypothetical protein